MEELFQYMKAFRSQINDVADQAAKMSVEEHMQCTTIQTLQKDLDLVNKETQRVKEETVKMFEARGQICSQISEKQKKIARLESDSITLSQTLELVQQERLSLSGKLVNHSAHYKKTYEDINGELKEQQEWAKTQNSISHTRESWVSEKASDKGFQCNVGHGMAVDIQAAQAKFDKIEQLKSNLVMENAKLRQCVELAKNKITGIKQELSDMDDQSLEEELQALLSDIAGESEYAQSLQVQIMRLKEISEKVRCSCGEEYDVKLDA